MLILLNLDASRQDIEAIKRKVIGYNCQPHEIPGESNLAIGITGPTHKLVEDEYRFMNSVIEVVRVSKKYKLVSRQMKKNDTVVKTKFGDIGGKELTIIAGPCSVESRDQLFRIAESLSQLGVKFLRGGAYKPRSSPYAFRGLGEEGLRLLDDVKKEFGMGIVTEVLSADTIPLVAEVADIIQIGARNMQNFILLDEVGKINTPILLKRGLAATVEDLLLSAEYILAQGNFNVILCERGIRTFETSTRNTLDLNAIPVIKKNSHLPILVDPSHGIGIRDKVPPMALAGIVAGSDGIIIEVHNDPDNALSDGVQTITPEQMSILINKIKAIAPIVDRELN
ncbi:MAG: 3-deoxy-7-phosphoheptulonate synthase [Bacteroidetes bacterium]|nr:3-deoxy-7-phosphoheptulonate synthase [Bacteroidota bacterium]MBU1115791.1 3-deoxy-7-phosphoheptulonate synthase [Bacteroidota bacterium]MBU1798537.1 3-deoxy-7-phosphoheptulonate synthase [Bacteroidota bacterium]